MDRLEYILRLDTQVEKFLELKHRLVFFFITAAVGTTGYALTFALSGERLKIIQQRLGVEFLLRNLGSRLVSCIGG